MKWAILVMSSMVLGMMAAASTGTASGAAEPDKSPFALVELFTSEGCCSCPPADALAAKLVEEARRDRKRVFVLAFHVDYWDSLGWKDPFADAAYTRRQRDYQSALGDTSVYTPEMIVNGEKAFIGSDKSACDAAVKSALAKKPRAGVGVSVARAAGKDGDQSLTVAWTLSDAPKGSVLRIALVERGLVSDVKAGENRGRTLRHENVVRELKTIDPAGKDSGDATVRAAPGVKLDACSVIAFVQDAKTMAVIAAEGAEVTRASGR